MTQSSIKEKRITAWIAMAAIVFVMLFSVIYISQHSDHECTGAECPVCAVMEECAAHIKSVGTAVVFIAIVIFLSLSAQQRRQYPNDTAVFCCSLISQKVRMNN